MQSEAVKGEPYINQLWHGIWVLPDLTVLSSTHTRVDIQ